MKNSKDLEWYVLKHKYNTDTIERYNIFGNAKVLDGVDRALRHYKDFEQFKEDLSRTLKYAFMSKAEHEIIMKGMFAPSKEYKIDIWYQLEFNIDVLARYIIKMYNKRKHSQNKIEVD